MPHSHHGHHRQAPRREKRFACSELGCDARFRRKFTLREHLKTHTGEKPFQCSVPTCAKLFSTSSNLTRHQRVHTVARIKCLIVECTREFTRHENLLRHLRVHMGNAAHPCCFPGCPKSFSTSGNLSRHKRTQHGVSASRSAADAKASVAASPQPRSSLRSARAAAAAAVTTPTSVSSVDVVSLPTEASAMALTSTATTATTSSSLTSTRLPSSWLTSAPASWSQLLQSTQSQHSLYSAPSPLPPDCAAPTPCLSSRPTAIAFDGSVPWTPPQPPMRRSCTSLQSSALALASTTTLERAFIESRPEDRAHYHHHRAFAPFSNVSSPATELSERDVAHLLDCLLDGETKKFVEETAQGDAPFVFYRDIDASRHQQPFTVYF